MDILVLAPPNTGAGLLQKLLTIHMTLLQLDTPVINCDHVTMGVHKVHSPDFNRDILQNSVGTDQSLQQIRAAVDAVDHYKVLGLRYDHALLRRDDVADQSLFHRYCNDRFYIIACRRHPLQQMLQVLDLPELPVELVRQRLDQYEEYLDWCENRFQIAAYFVYDQHVTQLEQFLQQQPWPTGVGLHHASWFESFALTFDSYNRYRFQAANDVNYEIPQSVLEIDSAVQRMQELKIIAAPLPVKRATLKQKQQCLRNFQQCVEVYNQWIDTRPHIASPILHHDLEHIIDQEQDYWQANLAEQPRLIRQ